MERQLIIGAVIFVALIGVLFYLIRSRKQESPVYTDILNNEDYKVKGQWDR